MNRYAIIGSGALGGLYGAMLAKAGHEVHFLLRSDHDHVKRHGWNIESHWGDFQLNDVNVHRDASSMPSCDVTIVATKTTVETPIAELVRTPLGDDGVVLILQNGIDIEQPLLSLIGGDRVYSGCCFLCSNKVGPGHIRHLDQGRVVFGRSNGPADRIAETIASEWNAASIPTKTTDDVAMVRWRKLMWNIPFNGLSVVLDASTKQLIENSASLALAERLVEEVHRGAKSVGVDIPDQHRVATIDATKTMVPYDSSMRLDYLAKRPLEIQAIFDNPIRLSNTDLPAVEMLRDQLRFLDIRNRGMSTDGQGSFGRQP